MPVDDDYIDDEARSYATILTDDKSSFYNSSTIGTRFEYECKKIITINTRIKSKIVHQNV